MINISIVIWSSNLNHEHHQFQQRKFHKMRTQALDKTLWGQHATILKKARLNRKYQRLTLFQAKLLGNCLNLIRQEKITCLVKIIQALDNMTQQLSLEIEKTLMLRVKVQFSYLKFRIAKILR